MKKLDITGKTFGRLTAVRRDVSPKGISVWECKCTCGNTKTVRLSNLRGGISRSCGCLRSEITAERGRNNKTHGMKNSTEWVSWTSMKQRCLNTNNNKWKWYGEKGITICSRWVNSFENFYADLGTKPPGYILDRIDNDGNYEPDNCRWATMKQSNRNRSTARMITCGGKTLNLSEWEETTGINHQTISSRIARGWSVEKSLGFH